MTSRVIERWIEAHLARKRIGANSLIFSVVDSTLLRPMPFRDADRIVTLWNAYSQLGDSQEEVSPPPVRFSH